MRLRFLLPLFLLCALLPGKLQASETSWDFETFFWSPKPSGAIRFRDANGTGSLIDLHSDLGIDSHERGSVWRAGFTQNNLRVRFHYEEVAFEGQKTLGSNLTFDGTTFFAGDNAKSVIEYDEFGVDFDAVDQIRDNLWGWAGFSLNFVLVEASISTPATGTDKDSIFVFAPGVRAGAEWEFCKPFRLGGEAEIDIYYHDYEHGLDFESTLRGGLEAYLACALGKHAKLRAGYRVRGMVLENRRLFLEDNEARLGMAGFFVSVGVSF